MGKKNWRFLWLLLVLAACVGGYLGIRAYNDYAAERDKAAEEAAKVSLSDLGQITNLSFRNGSGTFVFHREDDTWYYSSDPDFPLKQSEIESIAGALNSLTASRCFVPGDSLSAYGLSEPSFALTAIDADGNTLTLLIGAATGSENYVMKQDGEQVYTISSLLPSYLDCTLNDLVELETFPDVSEDNLVSIVVSSGTAALTLEKETLAVPDTESTDDSAEASAEPETAYVWYASRDGNRAAVSDLEPASGENASDLMDTLLDKLSDLAFTGCVTYKADAHTRTECGLDVPSFTLAVTCSDPNGETGAETVFTLTTGALNEAGNACYAVKDDSAAVNLIDAETVSAFSDVLNAFYP